MPHSSFVFINTCRVFTLYMRKSICHIARFSFVNACNALSYYVRHSTYNVLILFMSLDVHMNAINK